MTESATESFSAGGVVINPNGEVAIVFQSKTSSWSFPKGHIEEGEDELEAAKREVYEEAGISELELIKEFPSYKRYKIDPNTGEDKSQVKTIKLFLFKTSENDLKPIDPANPEARWVAKDEVANLLTHPKDKEFFLGVMGEI